MYMNADEAAVRYAQAKLAEPAKYLKYAFDKIAAAASEGSVSVSIPQDCLDAVGEQLAAIGYDVCATYRHMRGTKLYVVWRPGCTPGYRPLARPVNVGGEAVQQAPSARDLARRDPWIFLFGCAVTGLAIYFLVKG